MLKETETTFQFDEFRVINDDSKEFLIEENIVYIRKKELFDFDKQIIGFYNGNLWEISNPKVKEIAGDFANHIHTIGGYLIINKGNFFWVVNTYLKRVFSTYGNLFDINTNDKNDTVWFITTKGGEVFFYSNKGGLVSSKEEDDKDRDWYIKNGILTFYNSGDNSYICYNNLGVVILRYVGSVLFEDNCIIVYDDFLTQGCYSYEGRLIFSCEYDSISSRKNYVIGRKMDGRHYVYHKYHGHILSGYYDNVIPQMGLLITRFDEDFCLYDDDGKLVHSGKKFMYVDNKGYIHTYNENKEEKKKLSNNLTYGFID